MTGIRLRLFAVALGALIAGACTSVESFDRSRAAIDPDDYVVALSFDTSTLPVETAGSSRWIFDRAFMYPQPRTAVWIAGDQPGLTMVMLEAPGPRFAFGDLHLVRMLEDGRVAYYETARKGPEVELRPGEVTYIGTLTVEDVGIDATTGHPVMLKLRTHDDWENEAEAWRSIYAVLADARPARRIAAAWGGSGNVALVRRGTFRPNNGYGSSRQSSGNSSTGGIAKTRSRPD